MTDKKTSGAPSNGDGADENPRYAVVPALIEGQGRSVGVVLGARLCDGARAKASGDLASMTYPALRKLFKERCAGQDGYLSPQHPVLETALRILLTAQDDAMPLSEIHGAVSELWRASAWSPSISPSAMRRLLDNAASYGIARA